MISESSSSLPTMPINIQTGTNSRKRKSDGWDRLSNILCFQSLYFLYYIRGQCDQMIWSKFCQEVAQNFLKLWTNVYFCQTIKSIPNREISPHLVTMWQWPTCTLLSAFRACIFGYKLISLPFTYTKNGWGAHCPKCALCSHYLKLDGNLFYSQEMRQIPCK